MLSIALLVITLIATAAAFVKLPWTYQAESNVVLIPSQTSAIATGGGNPYLAFTESLNQIGDVIRYEVTDMRESQALQAQGYTSAYTITDAANTSAPVLLVTVTGDNKTDVEHTLAGVTQKITTQLATQQSGVRPTSQVRDEVISYTTEPTRLTSKKARPLLIVLVIGLLLTYAIPLIVDAIQANRRGDKDNRVREIPQNSSANPPAEKQNWAQTGIGSSSEASEFGWFPNGTSDVQRDEHTVRRKY